MKPTEWKNFLVRFNELGLLGWEFIPRRVNEKGYLVGINSKLANPVLQTDFRYLQGEQPDEKTLKEWGNYSWGIAINLVDEAAPDLTLFPERVIRKIGGIPANVLDIANFPYLKLRLEYN
ncbi:hypothetical protein [Trichormus variabilis]|uniref:Uncharacterized protein n=1 Tax=Trichormus variabilis SAG 1403-4b TaxID=447716 RepID=A0A433UY74_ANAVA|nr:hypothetical protein [Trichormus variabilis]RUS98824.1 hypothetical protein DSM107003_08430 [Trichormus variabilis SAG 1403-4b]